VSVGSIESATQLVSEQTISHLNIIPCITNETIIHKIVDVTVGILTFQGLLYASSLSIVIQIDTSSTAATLVIGDTVRIPKKTTSRRSQHMLTNTPRA
jgi:hypothetical protein